MAVGDSINYFKILTNAPTGLSRVLLSAPDSNTVLGNVEDPIQEKDAVNLGYLKKVISEIPGSSPYTGTGGIVIDPTTHVITADLQYIQDNLTFPQTLSNGIGIAPIIGDNLINVDLSGYFVPNPILMVVEETNFISAIGAGNGTVQLFAQTTSTPNSSSLNLTTQNANLEYINGSGISTQVFLDDTGMLLRAANLKISYLAGGGSGTLIADNAGNISKGSLAGFMHLTGAIDESADGNKTFTGVTQADYLVSNRIYSTGGFSPNTKFYNSLADGGAAFSIVGSVGSNNTNYLEVTGTLTGVNPILSAQGINTNIGINLTPKGTGTVNITTLAGTGSRVAIITSTGQVGAIANTTDTFVLTLVSGVPTWAAASGGGGSGITTLNTLTGTTQTFSVGTTGTDFAIVSTGTDHKFNIPSASPTNRGLVTNLAQIFAGVKTFNDNILLADAKFLGSSTNANNSIILNTTTGVVNQILISSTTRVTATGPSANTKLVLAPALSQLYGEALEVTAVTSTLNISAGASSVSITSSTGTFIENAKNLGLRSNTVPTTIATQKSTGKLQFPAYLYNAGTPVYRSFDFWNKVSTTVDLSSELNLDYNGTNINRFTQNGDIIMNSATASVYFGDQNTDTSWRIIRTGTDLDIQRREGGVWVSKQPIPA
jgi:hypothetical protein